MGKREQVGRRSDGMRGEIRVNLDVMLARRKMTLTQLSERVGVTLANLSKEIKIFGQEKRAYSKYEEAIRNYMSLLYASTELEASFLPFFK